MYIHLKVCSLMFDLHNNKQFHINEMAIFRYHTPYTANIKKLIPYCFFLELHPYLYLWAC